MPGVPVCVCEDSPEGQGLWYTHNKHWDWEHKGRGAGRAHISQGLVDQWAGLLCDRWGDN